MSSGMDRVVDVLDRVERFPVEIMPEYCVRLRHRASTCTRCTDACPVGAITWDEGPRIDRDKCAGCGICATACPTAALEATAPTNDEMLAQIQQIVEKQGWVAFACAQAQEGAGDNCLTVNCLGRLDDGLLVSAVGFGARAVWLIDSACASCPKAAGHRAAEVMAHRANALLEAFGVKTRVEFRQDVPAGSSGAGQGVSRRGLFKVLTRETVRVGEIAVGQPKNGSGAGAPPAQKKGELPKALPSSRVLLLAALQRLGVPAVAGLAGEKGASFARFQLGEGCTGCQMCAFFCPTGALSRVVDGNRVGLAFRVSHCVNCGLCRDLCYRGAALMYDEVDLNKVLTMAVDWCFAQEMDAEPWKRGPSDTVLREIAGVTGA